MVRSRDPAATSGRRQGADPHDRPRRLLHRRRVGHAGGHRDARASSTRRPRRSSRPSPRAPRTTSTAPCRPRSRRSPRGRRRRPRTAASSSRRSPTASQRAPAELADVISHEVGMPRSLSELVQAGLPTVTFGDNAGARGDLRVGRRGRQLARPARAGRRRRRITPWNYPLHQIVDKVAPALAAGCTVVLKPSEVAPVNAFILAEIIHEAGLPKGVFNLVTGVGPVVGEAIASHPLVDMVSFTGSTRAGKRVMELARAVGQARLARARRQVREHHLRGRRPRRRDHPRHVRLLLELRADLLGADEDARAARQARRGRAARRRRRPRASRRATRSPRPRARPAGVQAAARPRPRLHQQGRRRGRDARHRRRRDARRARQGLLHPPDGLLRTSPTT